tara:strand:+ start:248 stop:388 length:141 start_codon:yes stop_codon:yes gene_type:complete
LIQSKKIKKKATITQPEIIFPYLNIEKKPFSSASWTVVEPNCHFTK